MRCSRRRAISLVEAIFVLGLLAAAAVPLVSMYLSSHRVAYTARRMTEVTLHAQDLVEALAELTAEEFPPVPAGGTVLMADAGPPATGGGKRFAEVLDFFRKPTPVPMERLVTAERYATGELMLHVTVRYEAVTGEPNTAQTLTLPMLATPRNWQ